MPRQTCRFQRRQIATLVVPLKLECLLSMSPVEVWSQPKSRSCQQLIDHLAKSGEVIHFDRMKESIVVRRE